MSGDSRRTALQTTKTTAREPHDSRCKSAQHINLLVRQLHFFAKLVVRAGSLATRAVLRNKSNQRLHDVVLQEIVHHLQNGRPIKFDHQQRR